MTSMTRIGTNLSDGEGGGGNGWRRGEGGGGRTPIVSCTKA